MFKTFLSLLPNIVSLVHAFEGTGTGQEKKDAVLGAVSSVIEALPGTVKEQHAGLLNVSGIAIDAIVEGLNAAGVFKKGEPATATSPPVAPPAPTGRTAEDIQKRLVRLRGDLDAAVAASNQDLIDSTKKKIARQTALLEEALKKG